MVLKARRVGIKPVYFLKEVRGNRALIKISKRNSEVNKGDKVNFPIINSAKI